MNDLNKFIYFEAVARLGSISIAAKELSLSQPALSIQIKNFEEQLQQKLFIRKNRQLILTPIGEEILIKSKELIIWREGVLKLIQAESEINGKITIGTYTTASKYLLSKSISQFIKKYPKVSIHYNYEHSNTILNKLITHEIDFAILSGDIPLDHKFNIQTILKTEMNLVAKNTNEIPNKINKAMIKNFPFIKYPYSEDICYLGIYKKFGKFIDQSNSPMVSENFETIKQAVIDGIGISFIPYYLIENEVTNKEIKVIEFKDQRNIQVNFKIISLKSRKLPQRSIDLIKLLKQIS